MIRVVVADDQSLVRGGFRMIVDAQPDLEVVGEAADGQEAVAAAVELAPDVVLMDIRMPGMNGLEATRAIVARPGCTARILMLTTFDLDELSTITRIRCAGPGHPRASPNERVSSGYARAVSRSSAFVAQRVDALRVQQARRA